MKLAVVARREQLKDSQLQSGLGILNDQGWLIDSIEFEDLAGYMSSQAEKEELGADRLVVAGGDGSLNAVVNGLMTLPKEKRIPIVHLPMGTANDFYTSYLSLDHPSDIEEVLCESIDWPVRWVDVGQVNDRFFINVATGGSISQLTTEVNEALKNRVGKLGYYVTGVLKASELEPLLLKVTADDWCEKSRCFAFCVGNGSHAGGGLTVAPEAVLDDSYLDLLLIYEQTLPELGALALELLRKDHPDLANRKLAYKKVRHFVVESEEPLQLNLDGEPMKGRRFEFQVHQRALQLAIKDSAALIDNPISHEQSLHP